MRPVLSAIDTPEYQLAKWLEKQLKPYLNDIHSVSSSATFVEEIQQMKPSPTDIIVSFDIRSLYTNVPLMEVINDITDTVFADSKTCSIFDNNVKVTKVVFKNMLKLCSESIFLYNNCVYRQCDGVAMGSPLAPLLANWFVAKVENKILQYPKHKPLMYKRYVDDIFAVFGSAEDRDNFYALLNSAHPNLMFTMEKTSDALPFLDVNIWIKDGAYQTQVYRKPTNTGVHMNFDSMAPLKWKRSLMRCLLIRALRISSSWNYFFLEVNKIKSNLQKNGYPRLFLDNTYQAFIESNGINERSFENKQGIKNGNQDKDRPDAYVVVPFVGKPSIKLQHRLCKTMEDNGIQVSPAFRTTKVASYFNLKSSCPLLFKSNVVYQFVCSCDENTTYIGETRRQLFRRVEDHKGKDKQSAVFSHLYNCNACQSVQNISQQFRILKKCRRNNILSLEAILISKHRPVINTQLGPGKGTMVSLALYN